MSLDVYLSMVEQGKEHNYEAAKVAYTAYRDDAGGKPLATGQPIPEWDSLPESIRKAWGAAADAVMEQQFWLDDHIPNPVRFSANITHNLNRMADVAGIYEALWRPEEIGITHARQLIEPLRAGLDKLRADPQRFKQYNAPNGWGLYDDFVPWVKRYLEACEAYPDATVAVSR